MSARTTVGGAVRGGREVIPLPGHLIVRRDSGAIARGIIHVPERYRDVPLWGTVEAVGPAHHRAAGDVPMSCRAGDRVLMSKEGGKSVLRDDPDLSIIRENNILAVGDAEAPFGFRLLFDRLLLRRTKSAEKIGRFFIPETAQKTTLTAVVLATGPGRWLPKAFLPVAVEVGAVVLLEQRWVVEHEIAGEKLIVVGESEISGVVDSVESTARIAA